MRGNGFLLLNNIGNFPQNVAVFRDMYSAQLLDAGHNHLHVENKRAVIFARIFSGITSSV